MSDEGERLREESRERLRKMTPAERLAEALELGERASDAYAAALGIDRAAARHRLESSGQAGRRLSRVMRGIVASLVISHIMTHRESNVASQM